MRCYYEVLNLPETATNDDLKKAYRKLALKCHPDKNPGREDEANEEFKEVCQAYSTLTDPHERAFYDRNKESILRGAGSKEGGKSDNLDVFAYFSTSCFPGGFTDASDGFYATYRNFFDELSLKDMKHMTEEDPTIPTFGHSSTNLEDVAVFYGYWTSYCTSMPFAWADQIDIRQASCRYVEKKIERENRKFRDQARKQFNEDVRNLVLWVRKRDPRWKERTRVLEERAAAADSKRAQHQQRQREERQQQLQEDMQDQALSRARQEYLQQLKAMESQMRRGDDGQPSDEDEQGDELMGSDDEEVLEDEEDELICVVCIKMFSSERTKELHMKTKKHKQNLAIYLEEERLAAAPRQNVDEEEKHTEEHSQANASVVTDAVDVSDNNSDAEPQRPQTSINKKEKKRRKLEKKNQKTKLLQQLKEVKLDNNEQDLIDENRILDEVNSKVESLILEVKADTEEATNKSAETACKKQEEKQEIPEKLDEGHVASKAKIKFKNDKDPKKIKNNLPRESENFNNEISTACRLCHAEFASKNKLFQHIKATGHAIIKEMPASKKKGGAKRK